MRSQGAPVTLRASAEVTTRDDLDHPPARPTNFYSNKQMEVSNSFIHMFCLYMNDVLL